MCKFDQKALTANNEQTICFSLNYKRILITTFLFFFFFFCMIVISFDIIFTLFCFDFGCSWNEVKVVGQKYRRKARLVLVVLVLCAFLVAAVMLTFRQPSIRTDLKTGIDVTAKLSASITHGPTSSSNDSDLPFICPCSVPENSWCSYTTFYLLYPQQVWHFLYPHVGIDDF